MLAQDVQPNRLERAKLAALDLLKLARYDRLGVVAFAGTAFLQCPLTLDEEAYRQSVQILEPGIIPQGGTALGEAIETAANAFSEEDSENHKVLILFTDGEDHEEHVLDVVKKVAANGMKIFTVGVGTASGELLKVRDENGNSVFLKDQSGNVVKSRLNEPLLQQIAMAANGFLYSPEGSKCDGNSLRERARAAPHNGKVEQADEAFEGAILLAFGFCHRSPGGRTIHAGTTQESATTSRRTADEPSCFACGAVNDARVARQSGKGTEAISERKIQIRE